jgi:hypothetical protein
VSEGFNAYKAAAQGRSVRTFTLWIYIVVVCVLLAVIIPQLDLFGGPEASEPNTNKLAIGKSAKIEKVVIGVSRLQRTTNSDSVSLQSLRENRIRLVNANSELLLSGYKPADAVFRRIKDGSPWFGEIGFFFYGKGASSLLGPPAEARSIVNPYALLVP